MKQKGQKEKNTIAQNINFVKKEEGVYAFWSLTYGKLPIQL